MRFLDISLNTFFGVRNFENTEAMRIILFLKIDFLDIYVTTFLESLISIINRSSFFEKVQNLIEGSKSQKKNWKTVFVFEIIASELVPLNCLY